MLVYCDFPRSVLLCAHAQINTKFSLQKFAQHGLKIFIFFFDYSINNENSLIEQQLRSIMELCAINITKYVFHFLGVLFSIFVAHVY